MENLEYINLNKHVAAIHCSNNISLLQRKIFNALLYKAYNKLMEDDFHYISISELSLLVDYNSKDTDKLKKAFKKLQSTPVEWNVIENENNDDDSSIWCSSTLLASTVIDKKRGHCRYEYSKTLASLLYHPEVYARIDLRIQNKFSSSYGLALYENCVRYRNIKTTGWIAIEKFKKLMGVEESKYSKFSDFNRRVISGALDEINNISDISVSVEMKRALQQVVSIKFNIENKRKPIILGMKKQNIDNIVNQSSETSRILREKFSLNEKEISSIIKNYGEEFVQEKINILFESESYKNQKISVPIAYLKSALKNDYKNPEKLKIDLKKESKKISNDEKRKYSEYCKEYILKQYSLLCENEKEALGNLFESYLIEKSKNNHTYKVLYPIYKNHGVSYVYDEFFDYLKTVSSKILGEMKSINEFLFIYDK